MMDRWAKIQLSFSRKKARSHVESRFRFMIRLIGLVSGNNAHL